MSGDAQTERFKWAMLRVAVGDLPWNTGMATADAIDAFPNLTRPQVDQVVRVALMELLDAGFIFFFRATSLLQHGPCHDR